MTTIDTTHPVIEAFEAIGYAADRLFDPSEITPENVRSGQLRLLQWTSNGVEMFDVDEVSLVEFGHPVADHAVEYGRGSRQPIDFDDPVFDEIRPATQLRAAADPVVTLFGWREDRRLPDLTQGDVLGALEWWGSDGWVPRDAAVAMVEPFGAAPDALPDGKEDPHVDGLRIVRTTYVVRTMAAAHPVASPEQGTANGHKKRRRQTFYDNFNALAREVEDYDPDE